MFIAMQCAVAKIWDPSGAHQLMTDKENVVQVYCGVILYSPIKKNQVLVFAWTQLKTTVLNEISQFPKDRYHVFSLICDN